MGSGTGRDEDIPAQWEYYFNRNLLGETGPAGAHFKAPPRRSSDMVREYRLVIAIDYGTTFTGQ